MNHKLIGDMTKLANGTKSYISHRKRSEHFCRRYEGWGIAVDVFNELVKNGFTQIVLRVGLYETLTSSIELWQKQGVKDTLREDYEEQIFLPEKLMKKSYLNMTQSSY
ncbi:Uncharacterised protein [uncultured archaeon]|nr:Uncharacterised protein [uncultured archaeon]